LKSKRGTRVTQTPGPKRIILFFIFLIQNENTLLLFSECDKILIQPPTLVP